MRKGIIFGMGVLFLVATLSFVSAYYYDYYEGDNFAYYNTPYESYYVFSFDDDYRSNYCYDCGNRYGRGYYRWEDLPYRVKANIIVRDLARDYDAWKINTLGSSSEELYYHGYENENVPASNWRNKDAYNSANYGTGNSYRTGYYYEPRYEYSSGTYNWRY